MINPADCNVLIGHCWTYMPGMIKRVCKHCDITQNKTVSWSDVGRKEQ